MRLVLLFGYSIFENILKPAYYSHLLLLVLALHHVSDQSLYSMKIESHQCFILQAESRSVTHGMVNVVDQLCRSFLFKFPELYTKRHNVQVNLLSSHTSIDVVTTSLKFDSI